MSLGMVNIRPGDEVLTTIKVSIGGRRALKHLSIQWECTMGEALARLVQDSKKAKAVLKGYK